MGVASMFVIMTAKQLSNVIKGRQNHNEHGAKHSYYEHPFQHANREDYHGKTRQNSAKLGKTRQNSAKLGKTRQNSGTFSSIKSTMEFIRNA